jgi:O-antigen ligase
MPNPMIGTSTRASHPLWIIIFFALLSSAVLLFNLPEKLTAILYLCFFFFFTSINPTNGIAIMAMSIPFFLGATHKPYFFLFEILVYGTLILGFIYLFKQKIRIEIPFKPLVLLLFLSALFSIPINAKEYYYEFWATPVKEIGFQWLSGHEKFPFFHLRALFNLLSGILLFVLTVNLFSKDKLKDLEGILKGTIWMAVMVCLIGILFLFNVIPSQQRTYLSLSLAGIHEGAISAFAFNRQYLAQFLLILLPFIFYFVYLNRKNIPVLSLYLFFIGLFIFALSSSMQRSAFLVFFLEMFLLVLFYFFLFPFKKKTALLFLLVPFILLAIMFLTDYWFLSKRFIAKLSLWGLSDPNDRRLNLWMTAWRMFSFSPFWGVGLGQFHNRFPEFYMSKTEDWWTYRFVRGEPHSFYLQTLSEQGAIGFLLLISLVTVIIYRMIKKTKEDPSEENKSFMGVLLISLSGWFLLGFFNNVSYVRSLGILFWILLGWSAGLTTPQAVAVKNKLDTKVFFTGLLVLTAAFVYQINLIYERPINPFFQTGLYDKELLPRGEKIRWTNKRAVFYTNVQKGNSELSVSAPLPGIAEHPQEVRLWIGKKFHKVILRDTGWHEIILPATDPSAKRMLIQLETEYAFNPKKSKISGDDRDLGIMIREKEEGG